MAHRIQLSFAVVGLLAVACGIDVVGIDPIVGPDGSAPSPAGDASTTSPDGGRPDLPPDCSKGSCAVLEASGFKTIAIGDATSGCPNGFDPGSALAMPTAKPGSCECDPCTTTGSTCSTGKVPSSYSTSSASCATNATSFDAKDGECVPNSGFWASTFGGVGAPPAKVGTCKAPAHGVRANVDATAQRVCTPRAETCAAAMCALPPGLQMCLIAPGDVECPVNAKEKLLVGSDVTMACGDCSCTPSATCTGKIHWWETSPSCGGTESGVVPTGVCTQVNQRDINSYRWEGVAKETCAASKPPGKAEVTLTDVQTVCCAKR